MLSGAWRRWVRSGYGEGYRVRVYVVIYGRFYKVKYYSRFLSGFVFFVCSTGWEAWIGREGWFSVRGGIYDFYFGCRSCYLVFFMVKDFG